MKYLKLFESMTELEVAKICEKYKISNWTLQPDGLVDVDGDVNLIYKDLTKLPLQFGRVTGSFYCSQNSLTTLEGAPKEVGGHFYCNNNKLTTLEGAPQAVVGNFSCSHNNLTTLEGAPEEVGGDFFCNHNQLTTLVGAPQAVGGDFYCYNNNLTTLEGAPIEVGNHFDCYNNNLTTLKWAPQYIGRQVDFLPNDNLPKEFINFLRLNSDRYDLQKYIFTWQKDYAIWRRDDSFNQSNFIQMMEEAQDELENIKFSK